MRRQLSTAAMTATLFMAGCAQPTTSPTGSDAALRAAPVQAVTGAGTGYMRVEGEKAGALFAALRPDGWNGALVVLLHGQVGASEPVQLPPPGHDPVWSALVDRLLSEGFGVAFSSFRVNGFAVKEGTTDTRIAEAMFTAAYAKPDETYLVGFSMGNHIGQKLVETSSARYDGFLAVCSALGGATLQWEYFINARLLFDYYFPGALPGNAWTPTDADLATVAHHVVAAVTAGPDALNRAVELASVDQLELPWTTTPELINAIVLSLLTTAGGTADFQAKTGGIAIDNTGTRYTGSSDDDALNAGIGRFTADPNARQFLRRFDPDGTLRGTPVLALHTSRDPVTSHGLHFPAYGAVLDAQGNRDLFATRVLDRFGHCLFTADELTTAVQDLVRWARTGVVPGT